MKYYSFCLLFPALLLAETGPTTKVSVPLPAYITDLGFTNEYLFQPLPGSVQIADLDTIPTITARSAMKFPEPLAHTGFVGRFTGVAVIRPDGSVEEIYVVSGNSQLLDKPAREFAAGLLFSAPRKNGTNVPSVIDFEFFVTEQWTYGPFIGGRGKMPNQPLLPARRS